EVGDAESGFENVSGVGVTEVVGENAIADESSDTAEEDTSGDEKGEAAGTGGGLGYGGGRVGHKDSQRIGNDEERVRIEDTSDRGESRFGNGGRCPETS